MKNLVISWPMVAIVALALGAAGYFAYLDQLPAVIASLTTAAGFAIRAGAFGKSPPPDAVPPATLLNEHPPTIPGPAPVPSEFEPTLFPGDDK